MKAGQVAGRRIAQLPPLQSDDTQERGDLSDMPPQLALRLRSAPSREPSRPSCPLWVEGTLKNAGDGGALEYFLLMEVRDEAGKVISRQSVGVGAIPQASKRIFSLRIETTPA